MSFSRAPLRRFNEMRTDSPAVGSYDPKVDGTIPMPYPTSESSCSMRRRNWTGSMQNLCEVNFGQLSERTSCYSLTSERTATRLLSTGCLGVDRWRRRPLTARDGGEMTDSGWSSAARAASDFSVKGSVKINSGSKGVVIEREKLRGGETKGRFSPNVEDGCEARTKGRINMLGAERHGTSGARPKTETSDKAKCEDGREASDDDSKVHCLATGETFVLDKGMSRRHALSASRASDRGSDQLERESTEEWKLDDESGFRRNHRGRSVTRTFQPFRPRSDSARVPEENWSPWGKWQTIQRPGPEKQQQWRRAYFPFPPGNHSDLLIDAMERLSRAEEEADVLMTRVEELETEYAQLEQARATAERDLVDEIDWRTEELEKMEAMVKKLRASKRRAKLERKKCEVLVENIRLENRRQAKELENARTTAALLRTGARRNKEELDRALEQVENLRLENKKKTEELENSQSLVSRLQSDYHTASEELEKSRLLMENLSSEIATKTTELERSRVAMETLQSENNGNVAALENSRLAITQLELENRRWKDSLRHRQPDVERHPTGQNSRNFSKLPVANWSPHRPQMILNSERQAEIIQEKPRRSLRDEDCEMIELEESAVTETTILIDGRRLAVDMIPRPHFMPGQETRNSSDDATQTELMEEQLSLSSNLWTSLITVQESSTEGCPLRNSLSYCVAASSEDEQNKLCDAEKSESIVTEELNTTTVCNDEIQNLSLSSAETSLRTELCTSVGSQEEVQGSPVSYRESENPRQLEERSGETESLIEIRRTLEKLDTVDSPLCRTGEEVPGETHTGIRKRDSDELVQSPIPDLDEARNEEGSRPIPYCLQSDQTVWLERSGGQISERDHGSRSVSEKLIYREDAGDRRTVENCREKSYLNMATELNDFEGSYERRRTTRRKVELKGTSSENVGLYRLIDVYEEHLENSRERFNPRTNGPRRMLRDELVENILCQATEKKRVEKFGEEKYLQEKCGEGGRIKSGRRRIEENRVKKNADGERLGGERRAEKTGEGFERNFGFDLTTDDPISGDYNTTLQWKKRYEELWSVAQPFKDLLSAFHSQRMLLQGHRNAGKAEIEKLSHDFAKVLVHEHERQRMWQLVQLREQNASLKKEMEWMRLKTMDVNRR